MLVGSINIYRVTLFYFYFVWSDHLLPKRISIKLYFLTGLNQFIFSSDKFLRCFSSLLLFSCTKIDIWAWNCMLSMRWCFLFCFLNFANHFVKAASGWWSTSSDLNLNLRLLIIIQRPHILINPYNFFVLFFLIVFSGIVLYCKNVSGIVWGGVVKRRIWLIVHTLDHDIGSGFCLQLINTRLLNLIHLQSDLCVLHKFCLALFYSGLHSAGCPGGYLPCLFWHFKYSDIIFILRNVYLLSNWLFWIAITVVSLLLVMRFWTVSRWPLNVASQFFTLFLSQQLIYIQMLKLPAVSLTIDKILISVFVLEIA